ncbi:GIY-YIG nuclease family protein [Paenibacillus thiaminolyticus]|uniref:GIY-YIG nuclease family protein n=1 Tax=Paenibacillus thiaminolyticus TaxID=49283 RepID=UPI0035A70A78
MINQLGQERKATDGQEQAQGAAGGIQADKNVYGSHSNYKYGKRQNLRGSYPNLKNKWLTIESQLVTGRFANSGLQHDWKEFGPGTFTYEVLEKKEADEVADMRWELRQIVKPWLEKLQPYGDRGYNKPPKE